MNPFSLLDVFTVNQATQAVTGILNPADKDQISKNSMVHNKLMEDINNGKLPAEKTEIQHCIPRRVGMRRIRMDDDTDYRSIVYDERTETIYSISRADLLAWCEQRAIRPLLLFPDPPPTEKKLHNNERNTLLNIIRALAELHGNKPSDGAYRKEAQALLVELASRGIEAPCSEKTLAGHLSDSFKAR